MTAKQLFYLPVLVITIALPGVSGCATNSAVRFATSSSHERNTISEELPDAPATIPPVYSLNSCDAAFSVVYQKLSFSSDKQYLEKLHYLYEATSQEDLNTRKRSAIGIDVPGYGTGSWHSNRSKVKSVYKKYRSETDYLLSYDEHITLTQVYTRSEDVQKALDAWSSCIAQTNNIPMLQVQSNTRDEVIVYFDMKRPPFGRIGNKVKVKGLTYSDNLTLVKGDITGKRISYNGRNTFVFRRKNKGSATVIVDLKEGYQVIPVTVPAIPDRPVYDTIVTKETYECGVEINVSKNWMRITKPDGRVQVVKFKNQSDPNYKLSFYITTTLQSKDVTITGFFYVPLVGGVKDYRKLSVALEADGTLSPYIYLRTNAKKMTGRFVVLYDQKKIVCVANCPAT